MAVIPACRVPRRGPILLAVLALAGPVPAPAADPAPPGSIHTTRAPPAAPKSAGVVQFDAYRGFDGPGQGRGAMRGSSATPMEIGVAVGLATCPDGSTVVTGLNAGGWRYAVAEACASSGAARRGSVRLNQAPAAPAPAGVMAPTPAAAAPGAIPPPPAPRCNPATWRCATAAK